MISGWGFIILILRSKNFLLKTNKGFWKPKRSKYLHNLISIETKGLIFPWIYMQPEFLFYKIRNPTYQIDKETQSNFSNPENQLKISFRLNNFSIERKLFPSKTHSQKKLKVQTHFDVLFEIQLEINFFTFHFCTWVVSIRTHNFPQKKIENQNWIGSNTTTAAKNCIWTFHLIKTKAHSKQANTIHT